MAHSPEDIRNNNVWVEQEQRVSVGVPIPGTTEATVSQGTPVGSLSGTPVVARTLDNQLEDTGPPSLGSITLHDEYHEDPMPDLTLENLRLPDEYGDPSLGYEFVNSREWCGPGLDNSHALLQQLQGLGVRVNEDYFTLDLDLSASRSASVSSESDDGSHGDEHELHGSWLSVTVNHGKKTPPAGGQKDAAPTALFPRVSEQQEDEVFLDVDCHEHEVAEAEILPSGGVKVTYENYRKEYRPKISPHHNYVRFLETVPSGASTEDPPSLDQERGGSSATPAAHPTLEDRYRRVLQALQRGARLSDVKMRSLSAKYARKLRRLLGEGLVELFVLLPVTLRMREYCVCLRQVCITPPATRVIVEGRSEQCCKGNSGSGVVCNSLNKTHSMLKGEQERNGGGREGEVPNGASWKRDEFLNVLFRLVLRSREWRKVKKKQNTVKSRD